MTIVTIESTSEETTQQLLHFAEEHGLHFTTEPVHRVLTEADMVTGIGRKATAAELEEYILKGKDEEPIDFSVAFAKYLD